VKEGQAKMKYKGDESRRVQTVIPGSLDDMHHVCIRIFHMLGPVSVYRDGRELIDNEMKYSQIRDGDTLVIVDRDGNSADFGSLVRQFSRDQSRPVTFTANTEQRSAYTPKEIMRDPESNKELDKWWEKTKFMGESEAQATYTRKPLDKTVREAGPMPVRVNLPFDGVSEAQAAYTRKPIQREAANDVPMDAWWEKTKFDGQSEFKSQYTEKPLERAAAMGKSQPISVHRAMVNLEPAIGMVRDSRDLTR